MTPSLNSNEGAHQQEHSMLDSPLRKKRRLQRGLRPRSPSVDLEEPATRTNVMDADTNQELTRSYPPTQRPPISTVHTATVAGQPPELYPVFACQWQGCSAILHNLETLKAHLTRMHCRDLNPIGDQEVYECRWQDCQEQLFDSIGGMTSRNYMFRTPDYWHEHLWHQHIADVAWQLGDGPTGGLQLAGHGHESQPEHYPDNDIVLQTTVSKQATIEKLRHTCAPVQAMQLIADEDFEEMVMSSEKGSQ